MSVASVHDPQAAAQYAQKQRQTTQTRSAGDLFAEALGRVRAADSVRTDAPGASETPTAAPATAPPTDAPPAPAPAATLKDADTDARDDHGVDTASEAAEASEASEDETPVRSEDDAPPAIDGSAYLLDPSALGDRLFAAERPNMAEFQAALEAKGIDASVMERVSVLYNNVGTHKDLRDWAAILESDDPLATARAALGAMYASGDHSIAGTAPDALEAEALARLDAEGEAQQGDAAADDEDAPPPARFAARSGNFAWLETTTLTPNETYAHGGGLYLIDANNRILRYAGRDSSEVARAIADFGLDASALSGLADQMSTANLGNNYPYWKSPERIALRTLAENASRITRGDFSFLAAGAEATSPAETANTLLGAQESANR
ncbi:hypothetical protein [Roseospira goensis]|uniref:Uncharacterized protein n=1 Tax=Roseospira goensis TaxID=391922 RepID=A0A7W6RZE3_9PROT|nr:hypothetical protein [Roseospira goensis]MBB4285550.1 hypothetical protein [Roseospira goensis]